MAVTVTPVLRTVTQYVVIAFRYDSRTHRTTVTKAQSRRIQVRMIGAVIQQRDAKGHWVRIPYVWSKAKGGIVYDRYLHLALIAASKPKPTPPAPKPVPPPPTAAPSSDYVTSDVVRHLLRRATYGPTTTSIDDVTRLGVTGWIDQQLNPNSINDSACAAVLARLPDQAEPIWHVKDLLDSGQRDGWQQKVNVQVGHMARAVWSRRQLLAVMEDFWANHFNVTTPDADVAESRAHYAYVLRTGAFGRFSDLLMSVTTHPAMLTYLNNRDSTAAHPNENHGRELLELHTVGVDSGYGEAGVLNSARILTGLSVSSDSGEFLYEPWRHWVGSVSVMGFAHSNLTQAGGITVARTYIDHLAHHPATAHRLAWKLARHFVSDDPPAALVNRLATLYLAQDTAIAPVLRALLTSREFADSVGAKTRRPYEQVAATARVLGLGPEPAPSTDAIRALVWQCGDAGHAPLSWVFPTGYPDVAGAWLSTATTLSRWNILMNLVANWWPNTLTRTPLVEQMFHGLTPANHGAAVDIIALRLFGRTLLPEHRVAALNFLGVTAADPVTSESGILRWDLEPLVALLLDSPYHLTR